MIQILLIEDDPVLGRGLTISLELEGYKVHWVNQLKLAFEIKGSFRLVILDLGLPDGSGLDYLKRLRTNRDMTPVVILTAQTHEDSVVEGLQAGANDYVRKPFSNRELLARIKNLLREIGDPSGELAYENLLVLTDKRKVLYGQIEIELNRREFDVLSYFIQHSENVVTREALLNALDKDGEIFDRTIDSHVSHLRTKLKQAGVHSIRIGSIYGIGYRLEKI